MSEYSDLLRMPETPAPEPLTTPATAAPQRKSEYRALLEQPDAPDPGPNLLGAATTTPDAHQKAIDIGRTIGSPADAVAGNKEAEQLARVQRYREALNDAPKLAKLLAEDPDIAKLASDDLEVLGRTERTLSFLGSVGRGVDLLQSNIFGFAEATGEATGIDALTALGRAGRLRNIAEARQYGDRSRLFDIGSVGDAGQYAKETVGEQLPMMAPGLAGGLGGGAAGFAVAGPPGAAIGAIIGAFIPSFVLGVGETQGSIKEKDEDTVAPGYAFGAGTLIAILDSAMPGKVGTLLVKALGREGSEQVLALTGRRLAADTAKGATLEGVTEAVQEVIGEVAASQATGQEIDARSLAEQTVEAFVAGFGMGGGVQGGAAVVSTVGRNRERAAQTARDTAVIESLVKGTADSKLRDRNPDAFAAVMAAQTKGTPVETFYVPAASIAELYQERGFAPFAMDDDPLSQIDGLEDQFREALAVGGDVEISAADYLTYVAPSDLHGGLKNDLRASRDGWSVNDEKAYSENPDRESDLQDLVERMALETEGAAVGQRTFDDVYRQLMDTGRVEAHQAAAQAALVRERYLTRAARLGGVQDPDALYLRDQLKIFGPGALARVPRDDLDLVIARLKSGETVSAAKSPVLDIVRSKGGVKVGSQLDSELRAMGINPKTHPGLFKSKGGIGDVDNWVLAEHDVLRDNGVQPDASGYAGRDAVLEALRSEAGGRGAALLTQDERQQAARLDEPVSVLAEELERAGLDPAEMTPEEIAAWVRGQRAPGANVAADAQGVLLQESAAAVAERFGLTVDEVRDILSTPVEELKRRDEYMSESNAETPAEAPELPPGSAKIGMYGDPRNAYVSVLREFDPAAISPNEREEQIRQHPTFARYVQWFREGRRPPPVQVVESDKQRGRLLSLDRRRVLTAREAGVSSIPGWYSPQNWETGLPLKYGDVLRAVEEAGGAGEAGLLYQSVYHGRAAGKPLFQRTAQPAPPLGTDPKERALTVVDILYGDTPKQKPNSRGVEEIARELMARGSKALKALGFKAGRIDGPDPKTDEVISRAIAAEIKAALENSPRSAVDWYTRKVEEALAIAATMHPGIATDPIAQMGFTAAMAITSQGETVPKNVRLAEPIYRTFKETGRFPTEVKAKNGPAMAANFQKLNDLLDKLGPEGTREFLHSQFTVGDLKKQGYPIGGENVGTLVYGSAILGPKIGGGFYQNLNRNYSPVTMDLWFMRAWGRITGSLVGNPDPAALEKQKARLVGAIEALNAADVEAAEALAEETGEPVKLPEPRPIPKTAAALRKLAEEIRVAHERDFKVNRREYDAGARKKSELTYAAERYLIGRNGINEQPGSGSERVWMRARVARAQQLLAQEGINLTAADLQAVWWYPEKDLYAKLGGRDSEAINVDYAGALTDLARSKGVSDEEISRAVGALDRRPRPAGTADDEGGVEEGGRGRSQADGGAPEGGQGPAGLELYQSDEPVANLVVQHNLSAANLIHADRIGGLAVPSLAVSRVEHPVTGFGEITLLGRSSMVDPKAGREVRVFDADVYSPRYPSIAYKISAPKMRKAWDRLGAESADLGHVLSSELDDGEVQRKGLEAFEVSSAVRLHFLRTTGRDIDLPRETAPSTYLKRAPELREILADVRHYSPRVGQDPTFRDAYDRIVAEEIAAIREIAPDLAEDDLRGDYYTSQREPKPSVVTNMIKEVRLGGTAPVDQWAARRVIADAVEPHGAELGEWVAGQFGDIIVGETVRTETAAGDYRYLPHTLDNVVKALKKGLRDGEGFNYGVGSIRSTVANQFRSLKQIQAAREKIVDAETMAAVKAQIDHEFVALVEMLKGFAKSGRLSLDAASEHMKEVATDRRGVAVLSEYYANLPTEAKQEVVDFLDKLANLPTEYFEAKIQRAVDLSEFAAAVVPSDTPAKVRDVLRRAGLRVTEYAPRDEASRAAAIQSAGKREQLLFQPGGQGVRGSFQRATDPHGDPANIIRLTQGADLSTALHEFGHFFLFQLIDDAAGPGATPEARAKLQADLQAVLDHVGVKIDVAASTPEQIHAAMTREAHELWARSFEVYLREGKAPSAALKDAFASFAAWLVRIYRQLRNIPDYRKSLTPEVRGVMDRLLATDEAIADAARASAFRVPPSLRTAMTAAEQRSLERLTEQANREAREELQTRVMRELARERTVWWKEEREKVRAQVEAEVRARPAYRAYNLLRTGTTPDGQQLVNEDGSPRVPKLDRANLIQLYGKDVIKLLPRGVTAQKDGILIDVFAGMVGYRSADELRNDLMNIRDVPIKEVVEQETDAAMKQRHGDMLADGTIAEDAAELVLNEKQLDLAALQAKALRRLAAAVVKKAADRTVAETGAPSAASDRARVAEAAADVEAVAATGIPAEGVAGVSAEEEMARALAAAGPTQRTAQRAALRQVRGIQSGIDVAAVKALARKVMAGKTVSEATPARYRAQAARLTAKIEKAIAKRDYSLAAALKDQQIVNLALAREAQEVQAQVEKATKRFARLRKPDSKLGKTVDVDFIGAARAILAQFGLSSPQPGHDQQVWFQKMEENDPAGARDMRDMVDAAVANAGAVAARGRVRTRQRPGGAPVAQGAVWRQMTVEEFRSLVDTVDSILHMGRASRSAEIEGERVEIRTMIADMAVQVAPRDTGKRIGQTAAITDMERASLVLGSMAAANERAEFWARRMDVGDTGGPFTRYFIKPIMAAVYAYREDKAARLKSLVEIIEPRRKELFGRKIHSDELNYTFGNKAELLHAILHTGNESNKRKLLLGGRGKGHAWGSVDPRTGVLDTSQWDGMIRRLVREGELTKADYDTAQQIWDLLEELKGPAQIAHRKMKGFYFQEVEITPIQTPFGQYRGGYVPALTEADMNEDGGQRTDAEAMGQLANAGMMPTVEAGFTKSRVEYNKPLQLNLMKLPSHIDKVLKMTHLGPAVRQAARLATNRDFKELMFGIDQNIVDGMLVPWLHRVARQSVELPSTTKAGRSADAFFRGLRKHTGLQAMAGNLINALQQVLGPIPALTEVKPAALMRGVVANVRQPRASVALIAAKSPFMKDRMNGASQELMGTLDDIITDRGAYGKIKKMGERHGYFAQTFMQNLVDRVVWMGGYDQSIKAGKPEAEAVFDADSAVRTTQGSFAPEDVSAVEAKIAFSRLFTQFFSYFNTQANLARSKADNTVQELGWVGGSPKLFYIYVLTVMAPAVLSEALVQAARGELGDDDDDGLLDDMAEMFFLSQLRYMGGMLPGVGQFVNYLIARSNDNPADDRISTSAALNAVETLGRAPFTIWDAVAGDGKASKAIRDGLNAIGTITGLPLGQAGKPLGYVADVMAGEQEGEGPGDWARGLLSGREAPRQ